MTECMRELCDDLLTLSIFFKILKLFVLVAHLIEFAFSIIFLKKVY
jgi:hypothetical protein